MSKRPRPEIIDLTDDGSDNETTVKPYKSVDYTDPKMWRTFIEQHGLIPILKDCFRQRFKYFQLLTQSQKATSGYPIPDQLYPQEWQDAMFRAIRPMGTEADPTKVQFETQYLVPLIAIHFYMFNHPKKSFVWVREYFSKLVEDEVMAQPFDDIPESNLKALKHMTKAPKKEDKRTREEKDNDVLKLLKFKK